MIEVKAGGVERSFRFPAAEVFGICQPKQQIMVVGLSLILICRFRLPAIV